MADGPHVFNLQPLLSGGKSNRTSPLMRWEVPQRIIKPAATGAGIGFACMFVDRLVGSLVVSWLSLIVVPAHVSLWWRSVYAQRHRADTRRFWAGVIVVSWLAFVVAHVARSLISLAPLVGGVLSMAAWPLLGAGVSIVSSEARDKSGSTRIAGLIARGRSTSLGDQLHLGLWPVPPAPPPTQWCDGAVKNPLRRQL